MLVLFRYNLRSLWVRRTTTLATTGGITLVVFVLAASRMLASGMRESVASSGSPDQALVMEHDAWTEAQSRIDHSLAGLVAAAPGVRRDANGHALITSEAVVQLMLPSLTDRTRISTLQVRGVSENVLQLRPEVQVIAGRRIRSGTEEAIVGKALVGRYPGLRLGEQVELSPSRKPTVVGVFESGGSTYESEIWVDLETVRSAFALEANISSITAQLEAPSKLEAFSEPLLADKQVGLSVSGESAYYRKISEGLPQLIGILGGVETLIFSIGAVLGAMITMQASVTQRTREIGVLRALGFPRLQILTAFVIESVALGLGGALCGVLLSLMTTLLEFRCINFATGQELTFRFMPSVLDLTVSVATGAGVGALGGLLPALRAARVSPAKTMRV